jgi:large conductance mechanosensitive channel
VTAVNNFLRDFKAFALSGNVVDLAIGVILAIAFGDVVKTFADNVLMQIIAAVFKVPDFSNVSQSLNGSQIQYGMFINALINFALVAGSLLLMVKLLMRLGLNFKAQGNHECEYCKSFVPVDATKCMYCTSDLEPLVAD